MNRKPEFLSTFQGLAHPDEWVTSQVIAMRWKPDARGRALTNYSKDVSRKLSNLERFGHIERRPNKMRSGYEYKWTPKVDATRSVLDPSSWLQPKRRSVLSAKG